MGKRDYDQVIRLDPNDKATYNNRGIAYKYLGQYQRAIRDYDKGIQLEPDNGTYYYMR